MADLKKLQEHHLAAKEVLSITDYPAKRVPIVFVTEERAIRYLQLGHAVICEVSTATPLTFAPT